MKQMTIEEIFEALESRFKGEQITALSQIPNPKTMKDLIRSAEKIAEYKAKNLPVTIVGDYDADGVCASAVLSSVFTQCGVKHRVIIPDRFSDGYGLSPSVIERIDSGLVVTVDNGISAYEASLLAEKKGLDLIITDHHNCPAMLPKAYAIVNPKQIDCGFEYKDICGAFVAWYLGAAVRAILNPSVDMRSLLICVMIATIADSVELVGLNRFVAQVGLELFNRSAEPYIMALRALSNKERFEFDDISFAIAPRINAAGRVANAKVALEFLLADSFETAQQKAMELERLNSERKVIESEILHQARAGVDPSDPAVVVYGEGWHEGVIGIVASRLADEYKKPAVVISVNGERAKGSARVSGNIDLYELIASAKEHLIGFGGHKKAAGLSLESAKIEEFKEAFFKAASKIDSDQLNHKEGFFGAIDLSLITLDFLRNLKQYEPFGEGNPKPLFLAKEVSVASVRTMGSESQHLKFFPANPSREPLDIVAFNSTYSGSSKISFYFEVGINEYRGVQKSQVLISEFVE